MTPTYPSSFVSYHSTITGCFSHTGLMFVWNTSQVASCLRAFVLAILSASDVLLPAVCMAGSFSSFRSQLRRHLLREAVADLGG